MLSSEAGAETDDLSGPLIPGTFAKDPDGPPMDLKQEGSSKRVRFASWVRECLWGGEEYFAPPGTEDSTEASEVKGVGT